MKIRVEKIYDNPEEGTHQTTILSVRDAGTTESHYASADGRKPMRSTLEIVFQIDDQRDPDGEPIQYVWKPTAKITPASPKRGTRSSSLYNLLKALSIEVTAGSEFDTDIIVGKKLPVRFAQGLDSHQVIISGFPKSAGIRSEEIVEIIDEDTPAVHLWEESELPANPRRSRAKTIAAVCEIIERFSDDFILEVRRLKQGGFAVDFLQEADHD